jgi:outer membrane receptor protein involved in Fe transport
MSTTAILFSSLALLAPQDTVQTDSIVRLKEFVVSATRSHVTERMEQPEAVSLGRPSVGKRAASKVAANLLDEVAGVQVQQTSAGQGTVVLRGLIGNRVLFLVDGVPMNNSTYRPGPGQYLATIDPEMIDRIEVVRGPASVMYGSDAQGGVVNVITRPHPELEGMSFRVAASGNTNDRGGRSRASIGYRGRSLTVGLGGTFQSLGDAQAGGELGRQVPTGFDAFGLDGSLVFEPSDAHRVTATVQHFRMDSVPRFDRYVDFRDPAGAQDALHLFDPQTRQLGYVRYSYRPRGMLLTTLDVTASLATQRETRIRQRIRGGAPDATVTTWRDDVYTPGVSLVGSSMVMAGPRLVALTWGAEIYRDALVSEGSNLDLRSGTVTPIVRNGVTGPVSSGSFPDGARSQRLGVFLSADVQILDPVLLSVGGRWSQFRNEADVGVDFGGMVENRSSDLTGQVGLVVTPAPRWRVAARVAEGFRAPNLYDLTRVGPVPGGVSLPNPDARPELSLSGELSVRYASARSALEVTGYVARITDFIDRGPGAFQGDTLFGGERVFQGLNVGVARMRGIEAEAVQHAGPVRLRGTLTYTIGDQEGIDGVEQPMSKIPPLAGTAAMQWHDDGFPIWVEYVLRWARTQDRLSVRDESDPRIPAGGTPGYAVHGVRAGLDVTDRLGVSIGFENIGDALYRSHSSGIDAPGRHLWLGASWTGRF